jgi:hypothetical protein
MARSQVTGASLVPSFPQTLEGERVLGETAAANGPTVPPRQYFGLTAMYLFLTATGLLEAEKKFRRIKGYQEVVRCFCAVSL